MLQVRWGRRVAKWQGPDIPGDRCGWRAGLGPCDGVVSKLPGNTTPLGFWGPIMNVNGTIRNLSQPTVPQGTTVIVTCAAGARVQVTLDGIPAAAPGQLALLQLNATERDDRRNFFCNATLEVDGMVLHRNRSIQLRVLCE